MRYYRLVFRKQDGVVMFSDIQEHTIDQEEFSQMSWDKPIVRHIMGGDYHFLSLDPTYLDAMILGLGTYQEMNDSSFTK